MKQKCGIGFHAQTHTHIHCQELHQDLFVTQDSVKMCEYLFQSIMLGGNTYELYCLGSRAYPRCGLRPNDDIYSDQGD